MTPEVLVSRSLEAPYPPLDITETAGGLRLVQRRGIHRQPPTPTTSLPGRQPVRGALEELAGQLVVDLGAWLAASTGVDAGVRAANFAWLALDEGWAITFGLCVFARRAGALEVLLDPLPPCPPGNEASWHTLRVGVTIAGLPSWTRTPVTDLRDVTELLVTPIPLHLYPLWPELATLPIFSARAAELLTTLMRTRVVAHRADQLIVRWQR